MLEKDIEKVLVNEVRHMGGRAYKFVSPGNDGVPDRIVVLPGKVIFIELKTETGRLSEIQKRQVNRLIRLGQCVKVLHGLEEVKLFCGEMWRYIDSMDPDEMARKAQEFYDNEI